MDYEDEGPAELCPRCEVEHLPEDFRGSVCGWCAEDLEAVHA